MHAQPLSSAHFGRALGWFWLVLVVYLEEFNWIKLVLAGFGSSKSNFSGSQCMPNPCPLPLKPPRFGLVLAGFSVVVYLD